MNQQDYQQEYQQVISELQYYKELLEQVDLNLINIKKTKQDLEEFEKEKSKEILAPLSNGIFVEADLKNKQLYVNIGSDVVVKKSIKETLEIINKQEQEVIVNKNKILKKIDSYHNFLKDVGE